MDSLPTKVTKFFHHNELNSCSLVKARYGGSVFFLGELIFSFFQQKNLGNFEILKLLMLEFLRSQQPCLKRGLYM